jgi:hypothetical protein
MPTDARARLDLLRSLEATLGPDPAATLMSLLPPAPEELATRQDLAELRSGMAELRGEMALMRGELVNEIGRVCEEVAGTFGQLVVQQRTLLLTLVATVIALAALALTLVGLT